MDEKWILESARAREKTLAALFSEFSSGWSAADKADCFINRGLLLMSCESYFIDIARLKDFHGIETADSHKRASFSMKWLIKFRPIQHFSHHISRRHTLVNEFFALWVACEHLSIDIASLPGNIVDHVLYHLRYRTIDPSGWALSLYLLQERYRRPTSVSTDVDRH